MINCVWCANKSMLYAVESIEWFDVVSFVMLMYWLIVDVIGLFMLFINSNRNVKVNDMHEKSE